MLSPLGGRVLIPWCLAVVARFRGERGIDVETMWSDDGFVVRIPDTDEPPDPALFLPSADEVESLVVRQLGSSALFAAKFREVAGRALLLPRRRPGARTALWQQRKRAADLLAVAARYGSFPAVLETYRECLRDVFDMPALQDTLARVARRDIRVLTVDTPHPSPFAASLLFNYVATFLYDGDAPLAERRAQALSVDHAQLPSCSGMPSCGNCSTPVSSRRSKTSCRHSMPITGRDRPTGFTTCCCGLAICRVRRSPRAWQRRR